MKLCNAHHNLLTGDDECFQCVIIDLRLMIDEEQAEIKKLKKVLSDNNIPIPQ